MKNNKMARYYMIRDIVNDIYMNYVLREIDLYGDKVDGEALAEECMLLVIDILNNRPTLSIKQIEMLAIKEAGVHRPWHI